MARGVLQQLVGLLVRAGFQVRLGGAEAAEGLDHRVGSQVCRTLEEGGRSGHPTPLLGPAGRPLKLVGHGPVGPDRGRRQVPGPAVRVRPGFGHFVEQHIQPLYALAVAMFEPLIAAGKVRNVPVPHLYYLLTGAVATIFVLAPECRLLTGTDPVEPSEVDCHVDAVISMLFVQ